LGGGGGSWDSERVAKDLLLAGRSGEEDEAEEVDDDDDDGEDVREEIQLPKVEEEEDEEEGGEEEDAVDGAAEGIERGEDDADGDDDDDMDTPSSSRTPANGRWPNSFSTSSTKDSCSIPVPATTILSGLNHFFLYALRCSLVYAPLFTSSTFAASGNGFLPKPFPPKPTFCSRWRRTSSCCSSKSLSSQAAMSRTSSTSGGVSKGWRTVSVRREKTGAMFWEGKAAW
jgi:hypothetical protein